MHTPVYTHTRARAARAHRYEPGEDLYENPQTVCDATAEPKQLSRFGRKGSAYGFDADEDADAKGGAAGAVDQIFPLTLGQFFLVYTSLV